MFRFIIPLLLAMVMMPLPSVAAPPADAAGAATAPTVYGRWKNGPSADPAFFPIAVWLQNPAMAPKYQAAGINLYVGLWQGPTKKQLTELAKAHMPVICEMNDFGRAHKDDPRFSPVIVGWMHGDEPDNAQEIKDPQTGKITYGPPRSPSSIVAAYNAMASADPTRPIMLNLGQGVANDDWKGRGSAGKPSDYLTYVRGGDIISFDVYPVAGIDKPDGGKYLWLVPQGVEPLDKWTGGKKIVWNCIECTHIGDAAHIATPKQVKAEVWMSLIRGSTGLIYFVHEFKPKFDEHALLDDPSMLSAVTAINSQIHDLAPVLNSPTLPNAASVLTAYRDDPIDLMVKRLKGITYLFAVTRGNGAMHAMFRVRNLPAGASVQAIGESRTIPIHHGEFSDTFGEDEVHLYRIGP